MKWLEANEPTNVPNEDGTVIKHDIDDLSSIERCLGLESLPGASTQVSRLGRLYQHERN